MPQFKLPLYYKFYQLLKILFLMVKNSPREYKHTLGESILETAWKCLDLILEVNTLPNFQKKAKLNQLSLLFDQLKVRLRMFQEVQAISEKQFTHLQTNYLGEIGKMIGGFVKWSQQF